LDSIQHSILDKEEQTWRMKSRALWLKGGDNNSNLFHQYLNMHKKLNTLLEIKIVDGRMVISFKENAKEGAKYFHSLLQEPAGCPIQEIM